MKEPLWTPSPEKIAAANMTRFIEMVNRKYNKSFNAYDQLYAWSVESIAEFWAAVWEFVGVKASRPYDQVVDDINKMPGAEWFSGAHLNFAENLLRFRDDRPAIVGLTETDRVVRLTHAELYDRAAGMAKALRDFGVVKGDRVAGFMPNIAETVIAMLAATSIGAVWSSCSPDFGIKGVLDRFGQIEPKVLFTADGYYYNGKTFDCLEKVGGILHELPATQKVVVVSLTRDKPDIAGLDRAVLWDDFISPETGLEIEFEQVPFSHPLYIMYSSGTTGKPKCMVQSVGGILLHQLKEHVLHTDMKREDILFYYTTCGWMMWNWLVCSLAVGSTIVLYDGSPFHPDPEGLWEMARPGETDRFRHQRPVHHLPGTGRGPARDQSRSRLFKGRAVHRFAPACGRF